MLAHLWGALRELFPARRHKNVILGLIVVIAIVPLSEMAVAKLFSGMVIDGPELIRTDPQAVFVQIAIFFAAFIVARGMQHAARAYRVRAINTAFRDSDRAPSPSQQSWEWALAFELTGVLATLVQAAVFSLLFLVLDPLIGIVNLFVAGFVIALVASMFDRQLRIQREFAYTRAKPSSDSIALRVRTRVITGEQGAMIGSAALVLMLGALLWQVLAGEAPLDNAIVLFLGLRLMYGQLSNLSSGAMRFARALANRDKGLVGARRGQLPDVTIGYSSLSSRLEGIPDPASMRGAEVVVVAQTGGDQGPSESEQETIAALEDKGAAVTVLRSRGVAKSRNEVMRQATRKYLVFCDDDVTVDLDGISDVVAHMRDTGAALVLARAVDEDGNLRKKYTTRDRRLSLLTSGKAATYEMVVDMDQVKAQDVWFDERFGAGARLYLGDEYIFIADVMRAGMRAEAVPITIAMHPRESSGSRWATDEDLEARAAAVTRAWGSRAWLGRSLFAARHVRTFGPSGAVRFVRGPHGL
ncbi:glycosyltransferase family 2 protein [Demequina activiva]|uniref:Glycosyltransferase 2-like domain-containing protein n=1 Tax=Demequina activiva TaxID=1582364 RepID=A0A919Q216_9MICO|nr:glycosyltransferase [Demequina activiva]GIG54840.1 hypothetical protein Dac01nite_15920 [Demequina activiva]